MASSSALSSGGVSIQPWESPKLGSGLGTGSIPSAPPPLVGGTSQSGSAGGSTGIGGLFAAWPGKTFPTWPKRGFGGGPGDMGGTAPR